MTRAGLKKSSWKAFWGISVFWLCAIVLSLAWNLSHIKRTALGLAEAELRNTWKKDIVYRKWAAMHGGVYVPITEKTPPNPYLSHIPDRDVQTQDGKSLTLMNPAYMARQVFELGRQEYGIYSHITSLRPLRPQNAPDEWEKEALAAFERGAQEYFSILETREGPYARFMKPFRAEEACLKCHAQQGLKEGDIAGGVSVSTPLTPYLSASKGHRNTMILAHLLIGCFGLFIMWMAFRRLNRYSKNLHQTIGLLEKERDWSDALIRWAPNMILGMDRECKIVLFNNFAEKITGYREEEVFMKSWMDVFIPDESRDKILDIWNYVVSKGVIEHVHENIIVTKSGEPRLIRFHNSVIRDDGNFKMVLSIGEDITSARQNELTLKENEEKLKFITDNMVDIVWITDLNLQTKYVSPSVERILGFTPDESKLQKIENVITPESLKKAKETLQYELKREEQGLSEPGRFITMKVEYRHKNGGTVWAENNMRWVRDETGKITGILGVSRDITERKKAEDHLREAEERWKFALEGAGDGVWDWNAMTNKVFYSRQWKAMLGYGEEEIGDTIWEWDSRVHPDDRERVWEELRRHFRGETPIYVCEHRVRTKDGTYKWILDKGKIMSWTEDHRPLRMIGTHTDLSQLKAILEEKKSLEERLLHAQRLEVVGRLAGGVAHDFNNLLQAILGNVELLLLKAERGSYLYNKLGVIKQAGERGALLVSQLLGFARKQPISPRALDLNEAIAGLLKMLRRVIGEDIVLEFLPEGSPSVVNLDPTQLTQILTNLLVNSADAIKEGNKEGKIVIHLRNKRYSAEDMGSHPGLRMGDYVLITISDNGVGMDQETLEHIFEPFFTTKEVGKGTGLGLATVYGIVRQNNGLIYAQSEKGVGTTMEIYLPRLPGGQRDQGQPEDGISLQPLRKGPRLLVVEDNPISLEAIGEMLTGLGYQVLKAEGPLQALLLARSSKEEIDLALLDMVMPQMNGRQLRERLQEIFPNMRFIYMSGYTEEVFDRKDLGSDRTPFIHKPFQLKELARAIEQALGAS